MNKKAQLICLWCAPVMGIFVAVGWWLLAKFVPPPLPSATAVEIAEMFRANTNGIRVGMVLLMVGAGFFMPFIAVISAQINRIEGSTPVLTYTQLLGGVINVAIITASAMLWSTAAFRPERDPELIQLLNDASWLMTVMTFPPILIQAGAIGVAILSDKSAVPVFPRWLGYLNFWLMLLSLPGGVVVFFKSGPFAWNGLLAFWLPFSVFSIWFNAMFIMLLKAIKSQPVAGLAR